MVVASDQPRADPHVLREPNVSREQGLVHPVVPLGMAGHLRLCRDIERWSISSEGCRAKPVERHRVCNVASTHRPMHPLHQSVCRVKFEFLIGSSNISSHSYPSYVTMYYVCFYIDISDIRID